MPCPVHLLGHLDGNRKEISMPEQLSAVQWLGGSVGPTASTHHSSGTKARTSSPASDGPAAMWRIVAAAVLFVAGSIAANASELKGETVAKWNEYVHSQTARVAESSRASGFL